MSHDIIGWTWTHGTSQSWSIDRWYLESFERSFLMSRLNQKYMFWQRSNLCLHQRKTRFLVRYDQELFSDKSLRKTDSNTQGTMSDQANPQTQFWPHAWNNPKNRLCSTTMSFKSLNSDCQLSGCSLERGSSTNDGGKGNGVAKQQRWG